MNILGKARTFLYMARPWNWLRMQVPAMFLGIFFAYYILGKSSNTILNGPITTFAWTIYGVIAVSAISAGGYIINDYFDKDIDLLNEPNRPIPSGIISENTALISSITLFGMGLLFSYLIGYVELAIAGVWILFAISYACILKRSGYGFESLIFGLMMSLTILYGSVIVLHVISNVHVLLICGFMAIYMTSAHITGTLKDVKGDLKVGCKTIPILIGEDRTRPVIILAYASSFIILLYMIWFDMRLSLLLLLSISLITAIALISNIRFLKTPGRKYVARALSASKTYLYLIFAILIIQLILWG